jgi:hypothetical protein
MRHKAKTMIIITALALASCAARPADEQPVTYRYYLPAMTSYHQETGPVYGCWVKTACENYDSQAEAQAQFDACGGSAEYNWSGLDEVDHDGHVCQILEAQ